MNTDTVWPFYLIVAALGFAGIEGYALWSNQPTLSVWIRNLSTAYPIVGPAFGVGIGLLIGHLWRW